MSDKKVINKIIHSAFWDYDIDPEWVISVVKGSSPGEGFFTKERLFLRLLERVYWYDLVEIFGIEFIKENLTPEIIKLIRNKTLKIRYETFSKLLSGETVSPSGWSDENRERIQSAVLFKRWHSPKPVPS